MLKKMNKGKKTIAFAKNSYSALTSVIVIVIVLVANLIIQELAGTSLEFDMSDNSVYEVSELSQGILEELDTEIEFTVIAQDGSMEDMVEKFIEKYTDLSSYISVEYIDPILYPSVLDTYNTTDYTIVVSCAETGKSTIVSISDILYYDELSYYYYGTLTYEFDGDGLFTSAISQVTSEEEYVMYTVTGHGEESFSSTITDLLGKSSVTTSELNLLTTSEIPEDCDLLAIIGPLSDITEDEKTLLSSYLSEGGNVMIMLGDTLDDMPNLESLFEEYGLELVDGYIADLERAYQGNGYYIIPNLSLSGDLANDIQTESVLIINSRGFTEVETGSDTLSVDTFMYTSDSGLAVTESTEESGTYILGAIATDTISEDADTGETVESRLTVYGTTYIVSESITSAFTSLENTTVFMNTVMENFDGAVNVSIEAKVIEDVYNVVENPNTYSMIFLIILPITILVLGFIVWNTRRKQ